MLLSKVLLLFVEARVGLCGGSTDPVPTYVVVSWVAWGQSHPVVGHEGVASLGRLLPAVERLRWGVEEVGGRGLLQRY